MAAANVEPRRGDRSRLWPEPQLRVVLSVTTPRLWEINLGKGSSARRGGRRVCCSWRRLPDHRPLHRQRRLTARHLEASAHRAHQRGFSRPPICPCTRDGRVSRDMTGLLPAPLYRRERIRKNHEPEGDPRAVSPPCASRGAQRDDGGPSLAMRTYPYPVPGGRSIPTHQSVGLRSPVAGLRTAAQLLHRSRSQRIPRGTSAHHRASQTLSAHQSAFPLPQLELAQLTREFPI